MGDLKKSVAIGDLLAEAGSTADDVVASRREVKLVVPTQVAAELRQVVAAHMALDEFVPGRHETVVHSVYFDGPDFCLFRWGGSPDAMPRGMTGRLAEPTNGLKFRLRAYGQAANGVPATWDERPFLELKIGMGTESQKRKIKVRHPVSRGRLKSLLALAPGSGSGPLDQVGKPAARFFSLAMAFAEAYQLRPRVTICYHRTAYTGEGGRLRLTFDAHYLASRVYPPDGRSRTGRLDTAPLSPSGMHSRRDDGRVALDDVQVLEIKHLDPFPAWLVEALEARGLPTNGQSFSKYKAAVPGLYGASP